MLVGLLTAVDVVNKFHLLSEIKKHLVRLIFSYMLMKLAVVSTLTYTCRMMSFHPGGEEMTTMTEMNKPLQQQKANRSNSVVLTYEASCPLGENFLSTVLVYNFL